MWNHLQKVNKKSFNIRGVINGKAGKAADIAKFSGMLTLSQPGGGRWCPPIDFALPKKICDYAPEYSNIDFDYFEWLALFTKIIVFTVSCLLVADRW